ncbi:MAG TPA: FliM/FliN family flagellar motor switch protein [Edaphobacter sp.]|nr:FliM/FliN family flagellar motor switch protein [Edaphobacter sp.]
MENTAHTVDGTPENALEADVMAPAHQPLLPSPQEESEAKTTDSECTELVPSFRTQGSEESFTEEGTLVLPEHLRQIPFRIELRVPLSRFTLRDLQQLEPGALLATEHLSVHDLVLTAAGERLLLVELEAVEQQIAARVKRLAWRHKWRRKA